MIVYQRSSYLSAYLEKQKAKGLTIGFVPTMGALHEGHISLVEAAKKECDIVVCSIFVNPTQFNNAQDLDKYPRTTEYDKALLNIAYCDVVYLPSVKDIYPNSKENFSIPNVGNILNLLEGKFRPGHFEGMMQVVEILLNKVSPHKLYMGLKDYQQYMIVCKMVDYLKLQVQVVGLPTIREIDGLAMSSRNKRLSEKGRKNALAIYKALSFAKENLSNYSIAELETKCKQIIESEAKGEIEYFSIVDKFSLEKSNQKENLIALTAAWVDGVRLIDNLEL
jgi:pantoate--beta-alanine ligase